MRPYGRLRAKNRGSRPNITPPSPKPPAGYIAGQDAAFSAELEMKLKILNGKLKNTGSVLEIEWAEDPWPGFQVYRRIGEQRRPIHAPFERGELLIFLIGCEAMAGMSK